MSSRHIARKCFGQNFLKDEYIISEIIKIISPKITDLMVEIGPGFAALTRPLLEVVEKLHVIEIDRDIIQFLVNNFGNNLIIHAGDALNFDYAFTDILQPQQKIRVVGNLPYNISTPLLFHLSDFSNIQDMHFMLQKEVVKRICAKPDSSDYGRLTIMLQYKFDCYKMLDVNAECFTPKPKVESAIIRLKPKAPELWQNMDRKKLNHIVTHAFSKRRKTINNSLKNVIERDVLDKLNIDIHKRAENLSIDEYLKLASTDVKY